ncbi:APC family permease [Acetilactobacillus jinshanensis]|uniref:Amino acid permease n=1 Tax=Acetilactobacillus jinshanensis TaxID=1720083 RepID=A0A4P6ZMP4_9LACO|nr:amino acid permease [Acetilactobacillus jinshanensis]QBP19008.1 amino acid permease [Acetilactobacillus jinshanensis]URL61905.1 amino acid permease [uncultured bacterium]
MNQKQSVNFYKQKDSHLIPSLTTKDFLALGLGTIVSTAIFTLPGIVAADHTGPAVVLSFISAAIVAGLVSFNYAEVSSTLPFDGSAYSWVSVIFGKFWGWIVGWALIAEYFIAVAFTASGLSANFRGLVAPFGFKLPNQLSNPFGTNGGLIDIIALAVILIVAFLIYHGNHDTSRVENTLVVLKVIAILAFVLIGATALHLQNYIPFIPKYRPTANGAFGGWQGIYAGVPQIFVSYIGFDAIAANSAEAKDPKKTMPRGIIGSLLIGAALYTCVSLILVGMFKYSRYANNAEPVGFALRESGHSVAATIIQAIAVMGIFTALIAMTLGGSRLIYSFGRDHMLPKWLGTLNHQSHLPNHALLTLTIISVVLGAICPFAFLAQLVSAGTLVAFMFVSLSVLKLRKHEGKDLPSPAFKVPFYPVLPILSFLFSLGVFVGLDKPAKIYAAIWFIIGIIIYFVYGIKHGYQNADN